MKTKNILMTLLLVMGAIAAKAAPGYPPELALVSQPVMVYNYNSVTVYYDVENIGDYTYRGNVYIYLDPDNGYYYAKKYVRVCPGRIKRIAVEIPAYRANPSFAYMIMPYYELGNELYSFTTFEYFEPLCFNWNGPRTEPWVVINIGPRPRYYRRPGDYRFYYDGYRPPMPPPSAVGHGPATPPPMNPMHHTYSYHHDNGYPIHSDAGNTPPASNGGGATVRPDNNSGSMSSGHYNNGGSNVNPTNTNNNGGSMSGKVGNNGNVGRPNNSNNTGSVSGRTDNNSGNVSRPNNNGTNSGSGRTGNGNSGNVSRPRNNNSNTGTSSSGRNGNNNSSNVSRPNNNNSSGSNNSSNTRNGSGSTRGSSSSSGRSGSGPSGR